MVASGIMERLLPANNPVEVAVEQAGAAELAARSGQTRTAPDWNCSRRISRALGGNRQCAYSPVPPAGACSRWRAKTRSGAGLSRRICRRRRIENRTCRK
jgi:hypothetical protein